MAWERYLITFDVESFLPVYGEEDPDPGLQFDYGLDEGAMHAFIAIQFQNLPYSCDKKLVDQVVTLIVQDEEIFKKIFPLFIQWLNKHNLMDRACRSLDKRFLQMLDLGLSFVVFLLIFLGTIFLIPIHAPILFAVGGMVTGLLFLGLVITAVRWVNAWVDFKFHHNQAEELGRELITNTRTNTVSSAHDSRLPSLSSADIENTDVHFLPQTKESIYSTIEKTSESANQATFFSKPSTSHCSSDFLSNTLVNK